MNTTIKYLKELACFGRSYRKMYESFVIFSVLLLYPSIEHMYNIIRYTCWFIHNSQNTYLATDVSECEYVYFLFIDVDTYL